MAPPLEEDRREVWEEWEQIYQPVIAFLGAAREPVTAEWLAALIGCPAKKIRERALRRWQRFLHQDQEQRTWRVVHRSFTDFLAEKIDDEADWRAFHARIADRYLTAWGGLEAGLPGLHDLVKLDIDVRYGLRHLAAHLEAAGREDDLHRLMRLEWSGHQGEQTRARFENVWYTVHERVGDTSGYLSDVDRAWRLTEEAFTDRRSFLAIGLECRYALMVTSLCSLAGNIPPELLAALVEKGIWPGLQGLAYARQVQKREQRSEALAAVAPYFDLAERDQALREALEAARAIESEGSRSEALAALAPRLAELGHPAEALEAARAIESEGSRSEALARAGPPPDRARAPRGPGGGAGHRVRGVSVRGAGRAGSPPDRARAPRGPGGGAGHRARGVPVPGAGRAGSAPGGAGPSGRGAGGGAGHRVPAVPVRGAGRAGSPPDRALAPRGPGGGAGLEYQQDRSGRWPRWPPAWRRPSGTKPSPRRWRQRGPSSTRSTGSGRWPL